MVVPANPDSSGGQSEPQSFLWGRQRTLHLPSTGIGPKGTCSKTYYTQPRGTQPGSLPFYAMIHISIQTHSWFFWWLLFCKAKHTYSFYFLTCYVFIIMLVSPFFNDRNIYMNPEKIKFVRYDSLTPNPKSRSPEATTLAKYFMQIFLHIFAYI